MDICVSNLPSDITGSDLRDVFESFGRVARAYVVRRRRSDKSAGLGFVDMPVRSEAVCAVLGIHGRNWNGQTITATEIQPEDPVSGVCRTRCHCRSEEQATTGSLPEARDKQINIYRLREPFRPKLKSTFGQDYAARFEVKDVEHDE